MACIIMYCQDSVFQDLYAYVYTRLEENLVYMHNFKSSAATIIDLCFFMKKEKKKKYLDHVIFSSNFVHANIP